VSTEDENLKFRGYLLALVSAAIHAGGPVAGKFSRESISQETAGFAWVLFAAFYSWVFFTAAGWWPRVVDQFRRHWKSLTAMGVVQAAGVWSFFYAIAYLDPTVATFLGRISAVWALLLGLVFLRERFNRWEAAGMAMAIGGAFLISFQSGELVLRGTLAMVFSTLCFALFTFVAKVRVGGVHPLVLVSTSTTVSALVLGPAGLAAGKLELAGPLAAYAALGAAAFFGAFLGISTFYRSFKYAGFAIASALRSSQPVFVAILSFFLLGMLPGLRDFAGGVVIIAGVLLITLAGTRGRSPAAQGAGEAGPADPPGEEPGVPPENVSAENGPADPPGEEPGAPPGNRPGRKQRGEPSGGDPGARRESGESDRAGLAQAAPTEDGEPARADSAQAVPREKGRAASHGRGGRGRSPDRRKNGPGEPCESD